MPVYAAYYYITLELWDLRTRLLIHYTRCTVQN